MSLNSLRHTFQKRDLSKWIMGFMFLAMVVTTFSWSGLGRSNFNGGAAAANDPDAAVATVNGDKITRGEYEQSVDRSRNQFGSVGITQLGYMRYSAFQQL